MCFIKPVIVNHIKYLTVISVHFIISENILSEATSTCASTLTLKTSTKERSSRSKLSNISSMNNIYDEGYQTASSNNSSVKTHQIQLAKSTGNINSINIDLQNQIIETPN